MNDWQWNRLGDIAATYAGGTPDRSKEEYFGGPIPWVKSTEVNLGKIFKTEETLSERGLASSATKWIPADTVLVALYGATAAQIGFLTFRATSNQAVLAVVPNGGLDSTFLFYSLTEAKERLLFLAQGSGQPNLNKQIVDNLRLRIPPLPQQRKIARILTTLDNVITQTEALIAKYQAIKQGLMHDLFSRGVDATGKLRSPQSEAPELYKQSALGWIPKEWEVSCVESEFQISTGFTLGTHRRPTKNIRQYLRVANVQRDEIRMNDIAVLEATDEEFQSRKLQVDDLLVVEGHADPNQIGRCARVTAETVGLTFQNHLFRLQNHHIQGEPSRS
jgi:type I restriction enzyme S subunit